MQSVARVLQHLVNAPAVKAVQIGSEILAHLARRGPGLPRRKLVVLVNVGLFQGLEFGHRVGQAGGGHAPSPDGGSHQVERLGAARQPLAKQITVHGPEDQALGTTRRTGHHADVLGQQAVLSHVGAGCGAGVNAQCFHDSTVFNFCSLGRQGVIGLTTLGIWGLGKTASVFERRSKSLLGSSGKHARPFDWQWLFHRLGS